jgi:glutathione S-transferase
MLELYTHPQSPCAQKVRIVLAEKGLAWTKHHVSLPDKENLRPEYLKLNPLGVVPTLVVDGRPVIESNIICEYLEDAYPQHPLLPADPYLAAQVRFWMKHVDGKLHPACGAVQWPLLMLPGLMKKTEAERQALLDQVPEAPRRERQKRLVKFGLDAPDVADGVKTYLKTIQDLDAALASSPWAVGDGFSLADASLAPYFQTLYQFGWTALYEPRYPRVAAWYARCRERASYISAVIEDFPPEVMTRLRELGADAWPKIKQHVEGLI